MFKRELEKEAPVQIYVQGENLCLFSRKKVDKMDKNIMIIESRKPKAESRKPKAEPTILTFYG